MSDSSASMRQVRTNDQDSHQAASDTEYIRCPIDKLTQDEKFVQTMKALTLDLHRYSHHETSRARIDQAMIDPSYVEGLYFPPGEGMCILDGKVFSVGNSLIKFAPEVAPIKKRASWLRHHKQTSDPRPAAAEANAHILATTFGFQHERLERDWYTLELHMREVEKARSTQQMPSPSKRPRSLSLQVYDLTRSASSSQATLCSRASESTLVTEFVESNVKKRP